MPEIPSVTHDILNCLANLSNDEVFTPPELANKMIDLLPSALFDSTQTTFLDPCCKSGVFLREIAKRLINSKVHKATFETTLPQNLSEEEKHQKRLDHIYHKQLYGIAITQLTALMSRRTLYCSKYPNTDYSISKFDDLAGNIRFVPIDHRWDKNGKCKYCGASQVNYSQEARGENRETHAYEFIHTDKPEELWGKMKFDVIIGNPPYQMSDGGSAGGAIPMYHKFVKQAKRLNSRYLCMIVPSRWFAGGRGLDEFRKEMLNDMSIKIMVDYPKSRDCFQGVDIAGGVCYFLRDRRYSGKCNFTTIVHGNSNQRLRSLNEFNVFIRDNIGVDIIHRIQTISNDTMEKRVAPVSPFGLRSFTRGEEKPFTNSLAVITSKGKYYIPRKNVKKGLELIDKYKVCIGYLNPDRAGVNNAVDGKSNVTTKISIYDPGVVITETYIVIGSFNTFDEAHNFLTYIKCNFTRYLVFLTLSSMHITKLNFQFVPDVDYSKPWTDAELYEKYGLSQEEIDLIESTIKPMA